MGKYIGIIGSIASVLGLYLGLFSERARLIIFIFGVISIMISVAFEINNYLKNKPLKFNKEENINYMKCMLKTEDTAIVFAGDLSWVDDELKNILKLKGKKLFLCAKDTAPYLDELSAAGINVYKYDANGQIPTTHFTILRPRSIDAKIAIASILDNHKKEKRIVYEFKKYNSDYISNWIIQVANDLFQMTKLADQRRNDD